MVNPSSGLAAAPNVLRSIGDIQVVESLTRVPATREREFQIVIIKAIPGTSAANMYVCLADAAATSGYAWNSIVSSIKSIQRGTIALTDSNASNTGTITAVVLAKSILTHLGSTGQQLADDLGVRITLTNTTTITASRTGISGLTTVGYQVVEYN